MIKKENNYYIFGEEKFSTKSKITERCQNIIAKNQISEKDRKFLMNLFSLHPEWEEKCKGQKIIDIFIDYPSNRRYTQNKCFYIVREDGTSDDISYPTCINGKKSNVQEIKDACRDAISIFSEEYISKFTFPAKSELSGEIINSRSEAHVDHYDLTFNELTNLWIEEKGVEFLYDKINETTDNGSTTKFEDEDIIKEFRKFHQKHTKLRLVTIKENLSLLKKHK